MWDERGLLEHSLRKKETKQIISKIEARQYLQMRSHRSEGTEVAIDYAIQLRHAVRKSKTEKLTIHRDLRERLITQLSQPARRSTKLHLNQQLPAEDARKDSEPSLSAEEEPNQPSLREQTQEKSQAVVEVSSNLSDHECDDRSLGQAQQVAPSLRQQFLGELTQSQLLSPSKQKKHFLPMLELYIQELTALKQMTPHEKRVRNLIVTMMVLAINRRQNNRFLDALDILLQTEIYFPKENKEMVHLKSVWLSLIGKIYLQISKTLKVTSSSRWKKTTRKSSIRQTQQNKRQKTIFIRSLASRKTFLDKFSQNLRKSRLIYESTYLLELKNNLNAMRVQEGRKIVSKISPQISVSFPEPQQLFPQSQIILNYAIVMVSKDKEANLFPINYPESLEDFVSKQDYTSKIVKINSYLIPTARCLNFSSALFLNFELILSILIILLAAAFLLTSSLSIPTIIAAISIAFTLLCLTSFKISAKSHSNISNIGHMGRVGQLLHKCCAEWQEEYKQQEVKFIIDGNCDVLIISFPIDPELEEEELSSFAFQRSTSRRSSHPKLEKEDSRKCSIKLSIEQFQNPIGQIDEESSDDNELNEQFWREIEAKYQREGKKPSNLQFQGQLSNQSKDEVIGQVPQVEEQMEVELVPLEEWMEGNPEQGRLNG